jgi:hypothetical protein
MRRWTQDSRLSPARIKVTAVLDQEAVRHSYVLKRRGRSIARLGTTVGNAFNRLPHRSVGDKADITAETDHGVPKLRA